MTRILLTLLEFYRRWLSPALHSLGGGGCKYLPTCSEYASVAIATHGPLKGSALAAWRLLRCHPFTRGGLDPVPPRCATPGSKDRYLGAPVPAPPEGRYQGAQETPAARPFPHEPLP